MSFWGGSVTEEGADAADSALRVGLGVVYDKVLLADKDPEMLVLHLALLMLVCYVASYLPPFQGLAFKARCYCAGMIHFFACRESKVAATDRTNQTRPSNLTNETDVVEKELIFIRHGESEWNEIFNRGKAMLLPRLFVGIVRELFCLPFKNKSVFLDSGLGATGTKQNATLADAVRRNPALAVLAEQGPATDARARSIIFTSNLRRCVQTALLGLAPRLEKSREPVYVYSCLQEAARNVDTLCLTPAKESPKVSCPFTELLDAKFNFGSKRWHERAVKRLNIFLKFAFSCEEGRVIVVGHSLYFKKFFQEYIDERGALPEQAKRAMKSKLSNCGVVRFKIQRGNKTLVNAFRIVPETIEVLHGDWV